MITVNGENLCEACFAPADSSVCTECGYVHDENSIDKTVLEMGSVLENRYLIGKVIGKGGFGITYLAYDMKLQCRVAIKEYYPYGVAVRDVGATTVSVSSAKSKDAFKAGADKFYQEAKLVAGFNGHPNIVSVSDFFYENDTVYLTMGYLKGVTLKTFLAEHGTLSIPQAMGVADAVCNALMVTHSKNVLHRDISPDNIMVCNDGTIKLLDFGAARQVFSEESKSLSVILKQGFAPLEQYQKKGKQGPWTDIYSLGVTIYYALTGKILDDPMSRLESDDEFLSNSFNIEEGLFKVLVKATMIKSQDRYGDIFEFNDALDELGIRPEPLVTTRYRSSSFRKKAQVSETKAPAPVKEIAMTAPAKEVSEIGVTAPAKEVAAIGVTTPAKEVAAIGVTAPAKEVAEIAMTAPAKEVAENNRTVSLSEIEETPVTIAMDRGEPKKKSKTGVIIGAVAAIAVVIGAAVLVPGMLDDSGKIKISGDTSVSSSTPEVTGTSPKKTTTKAKTTTTKATTTKAKTSKTTTTPKVTTTTTPEVTTTTTSEVTTTTTPKVTTTTTPKVTTTTTPKVTTTTTPKVTTTTTPKVTTTTTKATKTTKATTTTPKEEKTIVIIGGKEFDTKMEGSLNLKGMNLTNKDIKVLSEFTNITELDLSNNRITDLSCLSGLTQLEKLTYHFNSVRSLEFARNLTNLTMLGAEKNGISDLSPLSGHTKLTDLWLAWNCVNSISPISNCNNLKYVAISGSAIGNIDALKGKKDLIGLYLEACQLMSIEPLRGCTELKQVNISHNFISDITPLNSSVLDYLWMDNNRLNGNYDAIKGIKICRELNIMNNGFYPVEFYEYSGNMVADDDGFYYSV